MTNKYLKIHYQKVPLYRGYFIIILSNSVKKVKKYIPSFADDYIYASAYFHEFKKKNAFFIILNFNNKFRKIHHGTITHESIHTSHFILKHVDIKENYENDEAETYLAEWITDEVYKFIKQNGFKIK